MERVTSFLRYYLGLHVYSGAIFDSFAELINFSAPLSDATVMICLKLKLKLELCIDQKDLSWAVYSLFIDCGFYFVCRSGYWIFF